MANIKALALRITSTQGIEKITKSMKMVAAANCAVTKSALKTGEHSRSPRFVRAFRSRSAS
jgi:hypothetical protein